MIHYFDASRLTAVDSICFHLNILLKKYVLPGQPVIVMCIGSDRSTGDSLGPLVGYKLSKFTFENVHVYGCLQSPIHAANLSAAIDKIRRQHSRPFIIALDASLGKKEHIGFITIGTGPLKPGLGVKKKLPEVGDIHITGIVNNSNLGRETTAETILQAMPYAEEIAKQAKLPLVGTTYRKDLAVSVPDGMPVEVFVKPVWEE